MNIKIGKYKLSSDENQYIVTEIKISKDGKKAGNEYEANDTYHPTLVSALNNLIQRRLKKSDATTLIELKNDLESIKNELYGTFNETINIEKLK